MKLIVLLILCCAVVYVGYLFSMVLKRKLQIFYDLLTFCDLLENSIKLNKDPVYKIVSDNKTMFSKEFNQVINVFYYNKSLSSEVKFYLSYQEQLIISNLFKNLGKFDVECEINNLKANKNIVKLHYNELNNRNKNEGVLGVKLGVLFAVLVFIIFI